MLILNGFAVDEEAAAVVKMQSSGVQGQNRFWCRRGGWRWVARLSSLKERAERLVLQERGGSRRWSVRQDRGRILRCAQDDRRGKAVRCAQWEFVGRGMR